MIDIKAIREAAEAATPGPWEYRQLEWGNYVTADGQTSVCQGALSNTASMNHIAKANPATVLALCDEIERLRKDVEVIERARNTAMYYTTAARIPECGAFGAIAQDLDFVLSGITGESK